MSYKLYDINLTSNEVSDVIKVAVRKIPANITEISKKLNSYFTKENKAFFNCLTLAISRIFPKLSQGFWNEQFAYEKAKKSGRALYS